jgi:hypothetical protein
LDDDDAPPDDGAWEPGREDDWLPARPRRRLATPLTVALAALVLVTAGFIAGAQVQRRRGGGAAAAAGPAAGAGFPGARGGRGAAGAGGAGQSRDQPTFGSVTGKKGGTLYVQSADGTTVRVRTNAQSKVTRNAAASPRGIYPGDTVVVQGTKDKGDVVATQITATSRSAAASGGGFSGGAFRQAPGGAPGG